MIEDVRVVAYGRPATEALSEAIEAAKGGRPLAPVTVVVASNVVGLSARRLLGAGLVGPGGLTNVSFVTPFRLAELLAADLLLDRRPLTNPVLGAAVRRVLAEAPGPFAAVADHHATEEALAGLYAELSNVDPDRLAELAASGPAGARAVALHRAIRAHLDGFHDEADLARAAARRADLAAVTERLGHVVWFLPAPTTAPLASLLRAVLAAVPASVLVGVTGAEGADAGVWSTVAQAGGPDAIPADADRPTPPTADHLVSVTDADEEVRAVVRRVVELAEAGVALDRIGIFHPTAEPYRTILEQQLAAAGVPANGPARRRLADAVAGRTLLAALALPAERWRRDRVLALAGQGPVRNGDAPARPPTWERLSRQAGVVLGLDDWHRKLDHHRAQLDEVYAAADASADEATARRADRDRRDLDELRHFVDRVAGAVAAVETAHGWEARAQAARQLLHLLLGAGSTHRTWPEGEQDAFDRTEDALTRLAALGELEPDPSHEVFLRALHAELDVSRGRTGRFGEGVLYGPLAAASGLDLDAVFVVGCAEGLCPTPRRDDGLLPDEVRQRAGGQLALRAGQIHDQHRAFLAALAAAPAGRRTLTFPRGDLRGGGERLPSRWLLDSAGARAGEAIYATDFADLGPPVVEVVPSFATGVRTAPVHADPVERDLATVAYAGRAGLPELPTLRRGVEAQEARRSPAFTEWDGNLAGQPIPTTADRPLSPSRLEAWAACGYRYFLAHVLGLGDRDDPERVVDLSPLDRGSGVHLVLERFVGEAIETGTVPEPDQPWSPAQRERMRAIAAEVFDELEQRGRTGRALLWRNTRDDLLATLEEFLDADDRYRAETGSRPERVELPFGLDDADPVVLELPDGRRLAFRGRADRVDRDREGRLLVSDYKTGKRGYEGLDDDPVQAGTTLQLGLYAEAAAQILGAAETEAHYWMVNPAAGYERYGYAWTPEHRQRFLAVLETIADGIRDGLFPIEPGEWDIFRRTHDNCAYCAFDRVCSSDRGEQAGAKVEAPELRGRDGLYLEAEA